LPNRPSGGIRGAPFRSFLIKHLPAAAKSGYGITDAKGEPAFYLGEPAKLIFYGDVCQSGRRAGSVCTPHITEQMSYQPRMRSAKIARTNPPLPYTLSEMNLSNSGGKSDFKTWKSPSRAHGIQTAR
jgi:hypothetical protein